MLRNLIRRDSGYVGSHAAQRRAPADVVCETCGEPENITKDDDDPTRVVLAECSMCETWFCTPHYTMHAFTQPAAQPKVSWWKRVTRRG